jgi:hypothetical protein
MHSEHYNHQLRDTFRRNFHIDCVIFRPDQLNSVYTDPRNDVWMNVTDWLPSGLIANEWSDRFTDPRVCVIIEEEFEDDRSGLARKPLLELTPSSLISFPGTDDIAEAYENKTISRISS